MWPQRLPLAVAVELPEGVELAVAEVAANRFRTSLVQERQETKPVAGLEATPSEYPET